MSDVPRAREIIAKAAGMLPLGDPARALIEDALPMLVRERSMKRAARKSRPLSFRLACRIWRYYRDHPKASHQEIANALSVNQGRVSEVLTGTRFPEARRLSLYRID